ncbi:hypothetical protein PL8927_830191 [Planktothrix serta PCC 8927]|uniref:Uncharacterized protein n=1 Tax=Planktothrix serta PCC 8927 TaxID=671068 RepID=A0A7Z9BY25_9CYAN|nr:hypothetical protein [Planktothrix serta]VXD24873.1 hypothetical protein PL8927_830191 [Planktothrix serta PCC 8927]
MSDRKSFVLNKLKKWFYQEEEKSLQFSKFLKLIVSVLVITIGVSGLKQWGMFQLACRSLQLFRLATEG